MLPAGTELSPRPDWVPAWDDPRPTSAKPSMPATWRHSPASSATPTTSSAGCSASSGLLRRARQHGGAGAVGQRRQLGGWPLRLGRTTCGCGTRRPGRWRRHSSDWTRSAVPGATTTTRGAGRWRATRLSGAGRREVHEGGVADPLMVPLARAAFPRRSETPPVRARRRRASRRCSSCSGWRRRKPSAECPSRRSTGRRSPTR